MQKMIAFTAFFFKKSWILYFRELFQITKFQDFSRPGIYLFGNSRFLTTGFSSWVDVHTLSNKGWIRSDQK
jgi:hypothetical protein